MMGGATSGFLDERRKQAEQAMRSKPAAAFLPGFCFNPCFLVPSLASFSADCFCLTIVSSYKSFLPHIAFAFFHINSNPNISQSSQPIVGVLH